MDAAAAAVTIHEPGVAPRRLSAADVLNGAPLFPAFRLPVADIFAVAP